MDIITLLIEFEGLKTNAYKCPAGVWTIGIGSTHYEDGSPVKEGDTITKEKAIEMCRLDVLNFRLSVSRMLPSTLPSGAIDACTLFAYNVGLGAANKSTLFKVINKDPRNLTEIHTQFARWNKGGGKVLPGLVKRREREYRIYEDAILTQFTKPEIYNKTKSGEIK